MKIALLGYGRMGKMVEAIVDQRGRHEVILRTDSRNSLIHSPIMKNADVAIDFSASGLVMEHLSWCLSSGIPLVIGTTGWYDQLEKMKSLCEKENAAVVYGSNFSIGVNLFFELNKRLAGLMHKHTEYEPLIRETHHALKKDAPSGTAISLADDILKTSQKKTRWVNFSDAIADEKAGNSNELIILSHREGNNTGTHQVEYTSAIDRIQITHEAFSREGFALGAVLAAEWIQNKKGFFEFKEIFNDLKSL